MKVVANVFFLLVTIFSCKKESKEPVSLPRSYAGGAKNTVFDVSQNAFGMPSPALSNYDELLFGVGNSFFRQSWVSTPASTTARDGLGPYFNSRNCSSCHFKDGRGRPPNFSGELSAGLLLRLSVPGQNSHGGPLGDPNYGGQLQDQSLAEVPNEGTFVVTYTEEQGHYANGETYSLRKPVYEIIGNNFGPLDPSIMMSPRVGQQVIGLGLLEAISEATLIALEDEFDSVGDGISGKINYVWDAVEQRRSAGRFGWKANQPSLYQQTADAFSGDIGITTSLFGDPNCSSVQQDCLESINGGVPEIPDDDLEKVVLYVSNLAVPARRNRTDETVEKGASLFKTIGCESCHVSRIITGTHSKFSNLSNQDIAPYTDLLLHDMGEELADNRPDYLANGNEWRTQPLWGIGLIETVNNHSFLLHDGRARSIEEAILWHGGEAQASQRRFKELDADARNSLLTFLKSL